MIIVCKIPDALEVTGISRCGRVRKKSSKLMDFQSPDEIDVKAAKLSRAATKLSAATKPTPPPPPPSQLPSPIASAVISPPPFRYEEQPLDIKAEQIDMDDVSFDNLDDMDSSFSDDSENQLQIDTTVRHSAYMAEKSTKKKVTKDGKVNIRLFRNISFFLIWHARHQRLAPIRVKVVLQRTCCGLATFVVN